MRLLPNSPEGAIERERCAQAQHEEQINQETLREATRSADIAEQALVTSYYQAWIGFWQAAAMIGAFFAAGAAALYAKRAVEETRRIGEAQTRAYLTIKKAEVAFVDPSRSNGDVGPVIDIFAENSGQSPAVDFIYTFTIQYIPLGKIQKPVILEREFGQNWRDRKVTIPKGPHRDGKAISAMKLQKFLKSVPNAQQNAVMVHLKVDYEFDDVFGEHFTGEARFMGLHTHDIVSPAKETLYGLTMWHGKLHPMPNSVDWHPEGVEVT